MRINSVHSLSLNGKRLKTNSLVDNIVDRNIYISRREICESYLSLNIILFTQSYRVRKISSTNWQHFITKRLEMYK